MLRIWTLNIRCDTSKDGENQWSNRKESVVELFRRRVPDVAGLQEALPNQFEYLREHLPEYGSICVHRDGERKGEATPIFFRRDRMRIVDSGTFWLSETPAVPASKSWDSACARIATWAVFAPVGDREARGQEILVLNTHLDHRGQLAREQGAELIMRFVDETAEGRPVIVMGDLNGRPENPAVRAFVDGRFCTALRDALAVHLGLGPDEEGPGTFHKFLGLEGVRGRIDYIFASPEFHVARAEVVHDMPGGRLVSDHFPVEAELLGAVGFDDPS